ncbi:NfeD family protein [uncultured Eubacterium sp.]|uniref:NfeD family protein n=1 Tax=uncultured Eubacterium sp. TaxID=165185 RepID=UPI0025D3296C|nr:NfeD family protein [uncultured Eubacterium sp.]
MFSLSAPMIWLILLVIFILVEIATVGLLTIWFAGGALAAFFISLADFGSAVQVIVFLIVSLALVLLIRPLAQRKFNSGHIRTNAQTLIGEEAVVLEPIDNLQSKGRVMIRGQEWSARSVDDKEKFNKDDVVQVMSISGVKLMVRRPKEQ